MSSITKKTKEDKLLLKLAQETGLHFDREYDNPDRVSLEFRGPSFDLETILEMAKKFCNRPA